MFFVLSKILHQLSIIILFVLICFINRGHDLQQIGLASATLTGCLCGPTWPEWRPIFFHKKVPTRLKMICPLAIRGLHQPCLHSLSLWRNGFSFSPNQVAPPMFNADDGRGPRCSRLFTGSVRFFGRREVDESQSLKEPDGRT